MIQALSDLRGMFRKRGFMLGTGILLALGTAVRFYAAWCFRFSTNPDIGIHGLMARHIALGKHFPLFFYGQSYMGSMEAWLSALIYKAAGHGIFPVLLGSAIAAALSQWALYLWVRAISTRRAALLSLALYLFGSSALFYYNIFMGYPSLLLFGLATCAVCAIAGNRAARHSSGQIAALLAAAGLLAGLGWWSNNLVLAFLPAGAIALLFSIDFKRLLQLFPAGILGFLVGSSPWLLQAVRDPSTLHMLKSTTESSLSDTAALLLEYLAEAVGAKPIGSVISIALASALVLLFCIYLRTFFAAQEQGPARRRIALRLMPLLIIACNILLCLRSGRFSHVPAARYLLPILPALFACGGIAIDFCIANSRKTVAWLLLGVVIIGQWVHFPFNGPPGPVSSVRRAFYKRERLIALCAEQDLDVLRAPFTQHGINFASAENLTVCSYPDYDRYRPYRRKAFTSQRFGVLNDFMNFSSFLQRSGSSAACLRIPGYSVQIADDRPAVAVDCLPNRSMSCSLPELLDRDLSTPGILLKPDGGLYSGKRNVSIHFDRPRKVCGVFLIGPEGRPGHISDIGLSTSEGTKTVLRDLQADGWSWSGRRPYGGGPLTSKQYRFEPTTATDIHLSIPTDASGRLQAAEIGVITATASPTACEDELELFRKFADSQPVKRLYAGRYLTEQVNAFMPGIETCIPRDRYRQYDGGDRPLPEPILIDPQAGTVLWVQAVDTTRTRLVLESAGFAFRETDSGGYGVFLLEGQNPAEEKRPICWTAHGAYFTGTPPRGTGIAELPPTAVPCRIRFSNGIVLEAVGLERTGKRLTMQWYWRCPPSVRPDRWAIFTHFEPSGDGERFQDDRVFLQQIPAEWIAGQQSEGLIKEDRHLSLPEQMADTYTIHVGIYSRSSGQRLALKTKLEHDDRRALLPLSIAKPGQIRQ